MKKVSEKRDIFVPILVLSRFQMRLGMGQKWNVRELNVFGFWTFAVLSTISFVCVKTCNGFQLSGLAWIVIPLRVQGSSPNSDISWRIFTALCGVPALLAAIFLCFFPESPKFLIAKGQDRKALTILKKIYNTNHSKAPRSNYPVSYKVIIVCMYV